ncbi:MAG: hypothetical protein H0V68_08620 [Actinobacteria bacterium]|nr:hypothetical protein [Actinomycetota bacterium]
MKSVDSAGDAGQRDADATARFFVSVAAFIDTTYRPRAVLDVGCRAGLVLVRALRERGIEARCLELSGHQLDEVTGTYDLITCLDVLEHVPDDVAGRAIDSLTGHTDRILFSSTPDNVVEPTHVNVQPPNAWVRAFGERGFFPTASMATLAVSPHAIVFERREPAILDELGTYELVRYRLARDLTIAHADRDRIRGEWHRIRDDLTRDLELARDERRLMSAELAALEARAQEAELEARTQREAAGRATSTLESRVAAAEAAAAELGVALDGLRTSTWWRLGRPIRGTVTFLRTRLLARTVAPPPETVPGVPAPATVASSPASPSRVPPEPPPDAEDLQNRVPPATAAAVSVDDIVTERLPLLRPLAVFPVPGDGLRHLTLVTESLDAGSLIDGVGTSMILAVLIADRLDASLRIVTRAEHPDPTSFDAVLRAHEVGWEKNLEFSYAPFGQGDSSLAYRSGEIFLATSLRAAWAASRSLDPARVVYLLQEDERALLPGGEEQRAWHELLADTRIRFVVDTRMLRDHLVADGFENLAENGTAFEPAFPTSTYFRETRRAGGRRKLFFYARPEDAPDLVALGVEAIEEAVVCGILDGDRWEVHLAGSGIPSGALSSTSTARVSLGLRWTDYAALIRRVDVGLSLRNAPHPGYPTLDVAACGGVAVTSRFGPKQNLHEYSANTFCVDGSSEAIRDGIAAAVRLAEDEPTRAVNYEAQQLSRDWRPSLEPVLERLLGDL